MSNPPTTTLPDDLRRQLARLAGKALRVEWALGWRLLVILVCALLVLQLGADWFLDLNRRVRGAFLVVDVLLLGALLWWFGIRPWLRRLSQEQAALRAERHWPRLRSSVISAVQLSQAADGSPTLVAQLLKQVANTVHGMDFREAIPTKHLSRPLWIAAGLAALTALGLALGWPSTGVLLRRAALANIPLPTQTIVVPISGNLTVTPGTDVELAARAQGIIPRSGRVEITYAGQKPLVLTLSPTPADPALFATILPNVQQPFKYRIFLNDGRSEEFAVRIIHAPVLESVGFEQVYPKYTGLEATQHTAGNLNLLAGGTLKISAKADQPLAGARLVLTPPGEAPLKLEGDRAISGELPIPAKDLESFMIVLTSKEGTESVNNTVYKVDLTPDAPPTVAYTGNQPDFLTVVAATQPQLSYDVRDDFAIKDLTLCVRTDEEAEKIVRLPMPLRDQGSGRATLEAALTNPGEKLPWKEGVTLTYWLEATDNNDVTGPGIGKSPERQWAIISLEAKRRELAEKLSNSASGIRNLARTQKELSETVEKIDAKTSP
jgi:hypothetical protein